MYRLLIADENPGHAQSYERFFRQAGYDVMAVPAAEVAACLPVLRRTAPDLILVCSSSPGGNVASLMATLHDQSIRDHLPSVILLGNEPISEVRHLLEPPVVAYLQEPVVPEMLLARLQWVLNEKNAKAEEIDRSCGRRPATEVLYCVEAGT